MNPFTSKSNQINAKLENNQKQIHNVFCPVALLAKISAINLMSSTNKNDIINIISPELSFKVLKSQTINIFDTFLRSDLSQTDSDPHVVFKVPMLFRFE